MRKIILITASLLLSVTSSWCQSNEYKKKKATRIATGSVFTKIINRELPAKIVYEDDDVIAFVPLRLQAIVHLLIVPKKEIHTLNDATTEDLRILGKLFLIAKKLAKEKGISETGYRLSMNTNEDAGQSVFHIHLHLLGGEKLGPMMTQKE